MGNGDKGTKRKLLMSPAVLMLPVTLLVYICGDGVSFSAYPASFIVFLSYVYCALILIYWLLSKRNILMASAAASVVANGVLLVILSGVFQAPAFTLPGFGLLCVGMLMVVAAVAPPQEVLFKHKADKIIPDGVGIADVKRILDSLPFPCVFLEKDQDKREYIVAANESFTVMSGRVKEKLEGALPDAVVPMPLHGENILLAGSKWSVLRTSRGRQSLVTFTSSEKPTQAVHFDVFDAIDPVTGLYTAGFMKYKARSDIESVIRGKRRMSAALFKLSFHDASEKVPEDEMKLAYAAFGRVALSCVRVCDSAYLTGDGEVLVYMPDTPQSGAKVVISRIHASIRKISSIECPMIEKARLIDVSVCYTGGVDLPGYEKTLHELRVNMYRKNAALAPELGDTKGS